MSLDDVLKQLDELNAAYFKTLAFKRANLSESDNLLIFETGKTFTDDTLLAFPTAIAPDELMKHLPVNYYTDMIADADALKKESRKVALWSKKMQAGTGSSITRETYLRDIIRKANPEAIGAKGTDLYVEVNDPNNPRATKLISIAELQILQAYFDVIRGDITVILLHDIIGPETKKSLTEIWDKPSLIDPTRTYRQLIAEEKNIRFAGETFQDHIPTIDESQKISFRRKAPGGHGLFAVEALLAAYKPKMRPSIKGKDLIAAIGNGEDLSAVPDSLMLGLMKKEKMAIAMVTTTKTSNDLKGGQIALVKQKDGSIYVTIIEKAQAETSGQLELFEKLGLRKGDNIAFFNTNMALFNYQVLAPKINKLVKEIGEEHFLEIIAPDLIMNAKKQVDADTVERTYVQMEGAMASVILNLDKFWRKHYGEALVTFINVDEMHRTDFFSPIKTAFDYFMQFHSDRFILNQETMRLINQRPGDLPSITLKDSFYNDVKNVLDTFQNTSVINLDSLYIEGKVSLLEAILESNVKIISEAEDLMEVRLLITKASSHQDVKSHIKFKNGRPLLKNILIRIDKKKALTISPL